MAAPADAKSGVEQLKKLLDTKAFDPVAARIWAAQGWTLANGRRKAAEGRGDKAGAKAAAALEGAFLRLHNDLVGRGILGRAFGSAKAPFLETLRLAAERREEQSAAAAVETAAAMEQSAAAAVETAAALREVAKAIPEVLAQLTRQADAAERSAKAAERQADAAERSAAAVERLETLLSEGAEQAQATGEAVEAAAKALVALAKAEAEAKAKAETPAP